MNTPLDSATRRFAVEVVRGLRPQPNGRAWCLREGEAPAGGRGSCGRARLLPSPIGLVAAFEARLPGSGGASHSSYLLATFILGVTLAGSSTSPIPDN